MKQLLNKILKQIKLIDEIKKDIINNFDMFTAEQTITKRNTLSVEMQILKVLQELCLDMFEPINMTTIVRDGVYKYGESSWNRIEITAEQAFGKPYCSAEEWYKNPKLQALYPDKYTK